MEWQDICCDNSLPDWLRSSLLNSLANLFHTSIWARDGRYRQWEAFSCPNLHPMHIHFYRSLPFTLFFPSLQKDSLRGHARCQRPSESRHTSSSFQFALTGAKSV